MRNLNTEDTYLFTYENWLSKTKGPKRIKVCELGAVVDEEEMVEKTTYIIQVQTSDVGGGSHEMPVLFLKQRMKKNYFLGFWAFKMFNSI